MFGKELTMQNTRVYAGINLSAVLHNLEEMHKNIDKNTKIVAVIKTDGYGHGALPIAKAIEDVPYLWGYAVATADEAMALIDDGRKKPILILGISFSEQFDAIIRNDIRPCVCDFDTAKKLSEIAVAKNKICHIHIKIDTGMSRIGFQVNEETANIIFEISQLPNIKIEGLFTHFANADEADKALTFAQMDLFQKIIADAAADAHRRVQIIERFGQPADHPVNTAFPEGQYLKGLLVQVV